MMKTIIYELNEVPQKLFDFYAKAFPDSAFSRLKNNAQFYQTETADFGHLSPWVTWPTLHRGVSNAYHTISDLGQNLCEINKNFPSIWELLSSKGIKVGVFGSLNSFPLPKNLENYEFYVPDTFAAGNECFPDALSDFQSFNLSMVAANGRNVKSGIAVKEATKFLSRAHSMGLTLGTTRKLFSQVISEKFNKDRLVRRRTSQAEIAFDLYFKQLSDNLPDVSFFFTNHVASSMHRYWPTIFPQDYDHEKFDPNWLMQWRDEIPHAVTVANWQISKLLDLCDRKSMQLLIISSMGQAAVQDVKPVSKEVLITSIKSLFEYLRITNNEWEPRLSMVPQIVVKAKSADLVNKLDRLKKIFINGQNVAFEITSTGDIKLELKCETFDKIEILENGKNIDPKTIGIELIDLQDAAGSYAYHIPEGILINYVPKKFSSKSVKNWETISVLDVAPSLLKKFGGEKPDYMVGDANLFGKV